MNEATLKIYGRPNYRSAKKRPLGLKPVRALLEFVIANPDNVDQLWIVKVQDEKAEALSFLQENDLVQVTPDKIVQKKIFVKIWMNDLFLKITGPQLRIQRIQLISPEYAEDAHAVEETAPTK